MSKLRIFLVDDHAALREGLKLLINTQPDMQVVGQSGNGRDVLQSINKSAPPDVVVMDISMNGLNGAQTTERLKQLLPETKVLTLTRHSHQGYLRQMLQAGANGYVLKIAAADELINAIRTVAAGGIYLDPALADKVLEDYVGRQGSKKAATRSELTKRETEVLSLIAWGYSNKEIATKLGISVKTVEYFKAHSIEKLSLRNRTDIIRYALQQGWLQEG